MRKRFLYMGFATMLLLSFAACSFKDEEAERTPDVDFYIQYASERFDVPADEVSVVYFQKGTYYQNYNFFARRMEPKIIVPPVARLEWGGKTVSFSYPRYSDIDYYDTTYLRDDYYYDELYEGVRQYLLDRLEVKDVIVMLNTATASGDANYVFYGIRDYIVSRNVTEVTTDVVEDLLDWVGDENIELFVELAGDDLEEEIRALIDGLVAMDRWFEEVIVVSQLDEMEVRRETPNPYAYVGFDMLYVYGYSYDIRLNIIRKSNGRTYDTRVEYNGYIYSPIDPPQAQEQPEASDGEPVAPEQTDAESSEEPTEE